MPDLDIVTTEGEELTIQQAGGFRPSRPTIQRITTSDGKSIQLRARSMGEARKMLQGLARKQPDLPIKQLLSSAVSIRVYPKGLVRHELEFGGEAAGRSVVKSVMALANYAGISVDRCANANLYLRTSTGNPCFGYFHERDLLIARPIGVPLHCVAVKADPSDGLVLGYVEYFGVHRAVVLLGSNYNGPRVENCYAIDPRLGERIEVSVSLDFDRNDINAIYNYKMTSAEGMKAAFDAVIPGALAQKFDAERTRVVNEAFEFAFANCGAKDGEILQREHLETVARLIAEKLVPFILLSHSPRPSASIESTTDEIQNRP
ncbi:HNH endonuclease [Rhizobium sp. NPDC090279]|uniref:HNH endonuclease n=1 Tax=Rhizobium sp. NPDC090279 TaxID=3364499 RepID=UPI00383B88FC